MEELSYGILGFASSILFMALGLGVLFLLIKFAVKAALREYYEECRQDDEAL